MNFKRIWEQKMKNNQKTICARCGNEILDGNSYPIFSIKDYEVGEVLCHNCAYIQFNIYNPMNSSG